MHHRPFMFLVVGKGFCGAWADSLEWMRFPGGVGNAMEGLSPMGAHVTGFLERIRF